MGIISVLCAKALYGINYDQWKWVRCAIVITNNITNLLCHLDKNHAGVASFKALVINNNKKGLAEIGPETVHSIGSSPNNRVTLFICHHEEIVHVVGKT